MSAKAKRTFVGTCLATAATIFYVHYSQNKQREDMRANIVREEEAERRRQENVDELGRQQALRALLESEQPVGNRTNSDNSS